MPIDKKQITGFFQSNKKAVVMVMVAAVIAYGIFFSGGISKNNIARTQNAEHKGNITENDKLLSVIEGLRKDMEELKKNQGATKQNVIPENTGAAPKPSNPSSPERQIIQQKKQSLADLQKMISGGVEEHQEKKAGEFWRNTQNQQGMPMQPVQMAPRPENRLIKIDIAPTDPAMKETQRTGASSDDLYLPAGSFVSFTLTAGVYAPESGEQMPVSMVIDNAFVGPNQSSIPLKGCFAIGKAKGNTAEKFADIKPVRISCVWPDGESFEADTTGYVTDLNGNFGLKGEVDRHTGTFLSTVGITSFLEGFSQGLNKAQTASSTVLSSAALQTTTNISGSPYVFGAFAALGDYSSSAKSFFAAQMQNLVPTVKTKPGARGYIHLTAGARITGGKKNGGFLKSYPYTYNLSSTKW